MSLEYNDEAILTQWCKFLGSLDNLKIVHMNDELVGVDLSLHNSGDVESPTDLLSDLQELSYPVTRSSPGAFSPFIDGCQKVGRDTSSHS